MATTTKKYQILQKLDENGNFVLLHPETTASQVIEETNKKFMTDAERSKLAGLSNYTHPTGFKDAPETALTELRLFQKLK